jgi:hypothetical protein
MAINARQHGAIFWIPQRNAAKCVTFLRGLALMCGSTDLRVFSTSIRELVSYILSYSLPDAYNVLRTKCADPNKERYS